MNYCINNDYNSMKLRYSHINNLNYLGLNISKDARIGKNGGYVYPNDGRTKDPFRGMDLVFDKPALVGFDGTVSDTFDIDNEDFRSGFYKNYSKMNNSQITYYVDNSISQPFFNPVYSLSSYVNKGIFVDPMGSSYPEYKKIPITNTFNNMKKLDQKTKDTIFSREDLMSRQQGGHLKSNWTARFINN